MRTVFTTISCFLLLFVTGGVAQTGEASLHGQLRQTYQQWRSAVVSKNYRQWERATAKSRRVAVRNRIYSERRSFPAALFDLPFAPPALEGLKPLRVEARGKVAKAVFFGKVDFQVDGEPTDNLLILNFIKERGGWKYDEAEYVNLSALPKVRQQLKRGDYSYVKAQEFGPVEKVVTVPFELKGGVKYIAKVYVYSPGREVQVQVNKVSKHRFQNAQRAEVVIGGARDGRNEIQLLVKNLPGGTGKEPLDVRVFLMSQVQGVNPVKVFGYRVEENGAVKAPGTSYFEVTPEDVQKLLGK